MQSRQRAKRQDSLTADMTAAWYLVTLRGLGANQFGALRARTTSALCRALFITVIGQRWLAD